MEIDKEQLDDPAFQLMSLTIIAVDILEKFQELSNEGVIEVMMFNRHLISKRMPPSISYSDVKIPVPGFDRPSPPSQVDIVSGKYLSTFVDYIKISQSSEISSKVVNLVFMARGGLYNEELSSLESNEEWTPLRLYNLFYLNPLSRDVNSLPDIDYPHVLAFAIPLTHMIKYVNQGTDLVLKNMRE